MPDDRHCDLECKHFIRQAVIGLQMQQTKAIRAIRNQDMSEAVMALYGMIEYFSIIESALKREAPDG